MVTDTIYANYLSSRGAPVTPENMNRVREFYASNPDLMERRAVGLPGGLDDNSSVLDAMLDRHIANTSAAPVTVQALPDITPKSEVPPPSPRGPTTKQPMAPRGRSGGAVSLPVDTASSTGAPSVADVVESAAFGVPPQTSAQGPQGDDGSLMPWLLSLLGLSANTSRPQDLGPGRVPRGSVTDLPSSDELIEGRVGSGTALPPPQGRIESRAPSENLESVGSEIDTVNQRNQTSRNARTQQLQADVDAENDLIMRQMMEREKQLQAQRRAQELVRAGKKAVGRK